MSFRAAIRAPEFSASDARRLQNQWAIALLQRINFARQFGWPGAGDSTQSRSTFQFILLRRAAFDSLPKFLGWRARHTMPHCSKCGTAVASEAAFCPNCGATQSPAPAPMGGPMSPAETGLSENMAGLLCYVLGWIT